MGTPIRVQFEAVFDQFKSALTGAKGDVDSLEQSLKTAGDAGTQLGTNLDEGARKATDTASTMGRDYTQKVSDGITTGKAALIGAVGGVFAAVGDQVLDKAIQAGADWAYGLWDSFREVTDAEVAATAEAFDSLIDTVSGKLDVVAAKINAAKTLGDGDIGAGWLKMAEYADSMGTDVQTMADALAGVVTPETTALRNNMQATADATRAGGTAAVGMGLGMANTNKQTSETGALADELVAKIDTARVGVERGTQAWRIQNQAATGAANTLDTVNNRIDTMRDKLEDARERAQSITEEHGKGSDAAQRAADRVDNLEARIAAARDRAAELRGEVEAIPNSVTIEMSVRKVGSGWEEATRWFSGG